MLNRLIKEAKKSNHPRVAVAAAVVRGSRVIAVGHNVIGRGSARIVTKWPGSCCAEANAILKVFNEDVCKGADIFVVRVKKDGSLGMAKPCPACSRLIKSVGIRKVSFTDNEGTVQCIPSSAL